MDWLPGEEKSSLTDLKLEEKDKLLEKFILNPILKNSPFIHLLSKLLSVLVNLEKPNSEWSFNFLKFKSKLEEITWLFKLVS